MCVAFAAAPLLPFGAGAGLGRQDSLPWDSSVAHRERELSQPIDDERTFSMGQAPTHFSSRLELPRSVRDDGSDTSCTLEGGVHAGARRRGAARGVA